MGGEVYWHGGCLTFPREANLKSKGDKGKGKRKSKTKGENQKELS